MQLNLSGNKYWLAAGAVIIFLIIALYPKATYKSLSMEITRTQAIDSAKKFLTEHGVNLTGFNEEAFIDNAPVEIRYILKKLGREKFKEYYTSKSWANFGWNIMFHQNLSRQFHQTTYYVDVSNSGKIFGFREVIPDTVSLQSLTRTEATEFISNYLEDVLDDEFEEYKLIETREENFRNRTDFAFRWEKDESDLNAKIIITGRVQGNTIAGYQHFFEVPQSDREYFEAGEAIFSTISVVFVVILMMIAFYLFLKKYHQGEVWMSVGRLFFIIFFSISILEMINYWPAIGQGAFVGDLSFIYVKIIVYMVNFIMLFFLSLLVFASWTVSESYARSLWPNKLKGIDAFIKGHITSLESGNSMLKGLVIGSAIAFSFMLGDIILNKPNSTIFVSPTNLVDMFGVYIPAFSIIGGAFSNAILASIAITFFVVNISYQRWKKKWVSILITGLVTTFAFVIASTPPSLNNFAVNLFSGFIFGCTIAYFYFAFDLLTIVSIHFHTALISRGYALYSANNSYYDINFIIVVIVIALTPLIYFISVFKKESFVLENFGLPSHVKRISERERLKKEMEIAAKVQLSLLPKEDPKIPGYEIASTSIPAVEAGGDYYDFVKLSGNKIGIAIGDVSGKGVGAAIYMTLTKGILQAHAEEDASPKNVLGKVNRLLYKTIEKNSFVSMFYAILDTENNSIIYSRAGHNPGILCSEQDGNTKLLFSKGMALGLEQGSIFTSTLNEEEIKINSGDVFVLYTDGFTEAMNERQELYSEERLVDLIKKNRNLSPHDLLNLVLKDVKKFVDNYPQHDDMTIVILKRV